jgi:hypothetical protein
MATHRSTPAGALAAALAGLAIATGAGAQPLIPPDSCRPLSGITGPEDIQAEPDGGLIVSAMDWHAPKSAPSVQDGLYFIPASGPPRLERLPGAPADLHPHGLYIVQDPRLGEVLMVVDHHRDGATDIVQFEVTHPGGHPALKLLRRVSDPALASANDLAALDGTRFYVSASRTGLVLFFDGEVLRPALSGLKTPNGVALSIDKAHLYVAETTGARLRSYRRADGEALSEEAAITVSGAPDNIDVDPRGGLWLAVHPSPGAFLVWFQNKDAKPSPSAIYWLPTRDGTPVGAELRLQDDGSHIGAASVAAAARSRIAIGSTLDSKILICARPPPPR